jgi:hypothetical protein
MLIKEMINAAKIIISPESVTKRLFFFNGFSISPPPHHFQSLPEPLHTHLGFEPLCQKEEGMNGPISGIFSSEIS